MMTSERIRTIAKEYRWVIIASIFFIVWKFFLIGVMWEGRSIPPEPDDSYEYIAHIASVSECGTGILCRYPGVSMTDHSGFTYLSYSIFLGLIGKISHLQPEITYHAGFYIGTLLLLIILIPFLRSFTSNKNLIAWSILFLAFYHGTGESHGFFWVVPSFFSALLFFVLFTIVVKKNTTSYWLVGFISIVYAFSHPMSVYLIFVLPIYLTTLYIISKTFDVPVLKRASFIVFIVLLSSFFQMQYLANAHQIDYYGIKQSFLQAKMTANSITNGETDEQVFGYSITKTADKDLLKQRFATLDTAYFRYVLPHWIAIIPFAAVLILLFVKKNFKILSLYLSSLIFFVIATLLHEFGFRSAVILWPLTFIAYSFAAWHLFGYAKRLPQPQRNISIGITAVGTICFLVVNASLAITFNSNLNIRHRYTIDQSFAEYLSKNMRQNDKTSLNGILVRTSGGASLYLDNKIASPSDQPKYLAIIDESGLLIEQRKPTVTRDLSAMITKNLLGIPIMSTEPNRNTPTIPTGYDLEKEFGVVKIYRNQN